jgi:hypothetical protein
MKFLSLYTPDPKTVEQHAKKGNDAEMGKLIEEALKSGELLATVGLMSLEKGGARVRSSAGKISVVDGPYAEAKELIGGFAMLETKSSEAAIEICRRFLKIAGDGEIELRQIDMPE